MRCARGKIISVCSWRVRSFTMLYQAVQCILYGHTYDHVCDLKRFSNSDGWLCCKHSGKELAERPLRWKRCCLLLTFVWSSSVATLTPKEHAIATITRPSIDE